MMKATFIIFFLISQMFLAHSAFAYSVNTSYVVHNGTYSYGFSYPYSNTYNTSSNTVSGGPRIVTIECAENSNYLYETPGIQPMVYFEPTCRSLTGEQFSSFSRRGSTEFSGFSNYRCVTYRVSNNPNGQCLVYRYEATYTPPQPYTTQPAKTDPYIRNTISPIYTAPVSGNATPACMDEQPGMAYPMVNINCSCPDGSINISNGGYHTCDNVYGLHTVAPTRELSSSKRCYTSSSNCMNGEVQYQNTPSYSWATYGSSQYSYSR